MRETWVPEGFWWQGRFERGLEATFDQGRLVEVRATTKRAEPIWLSPAFVNAHSHLEYRGFQDQLGGLDYWPWIRELAARKPHQTDDEVLRDCLLAAQENRRTGVGFVYEHSDRVGAVAALRTVGLRAYVFQEVITFFEGDAPGEKLEAIEAKLLAQQADQPTPHSPHLVDLRTLAGFADTPRVSLHVAETPLENAFWERHEGAIADLFTAFGRGLPPRGRRVTEWLSELGLMRSGVQWVHACDLTPYEVERAAEAGVVVAHCPRSNLALGCPPAPVEAMLGAGMAVGLGLDSAASSGPIDFFEEMRAALQITPSLSAETLWNMATQMGAASVGLEGWGALNSETPWIAIEAAADSAEALLMAGRADAVRWIGEV